MKSVQEPKGVPDADCLVIVVGKIVERKDIDRDADGEAGTAFVADGPFVADLGHAMMKTGGVFMGMDTNDATWVLKGADEALVVLAEHDDVDVVVPWDEPTMADSTEQCAKTDDVGNIVSTAERVNKAHDVEQDLLVFSDADGPIPQLSIG